MESNLRNHLLEKERVWCREYAAKSDSELLTMRSYKSEVTAKFNNIEFRLPFQRDRDRIIHSRAFRRLMHKTQIFNANKGDHYRNRLTHTLEVCQIARSIGKVLELNDELIEAIALGHDVGHAPFGHIGERTLHEIVSGNYQDIEFEHNKLGFKHNFQGIQLFENLEKAISNVSGLNLTTAVLDGILKHTGMYYKRTSKCPNVYYPSLNFKDRIDISKPAMTLEGQVVGIADEIAQVTHDLEDGIRAKIITDSVINSSKLVKHLQEKYGLIFNDHHETVDYRITLIKHLISFLIDDVCKASRIRLNEYGAFPNFQDLTDVFDTQVIDFSDGNNETTNIKEYQKELADKISDALVASEEVSISDSKAQYIIKRIFKAYIMNPQQLPDHILKRYCALKHEDFSRLKISNKNQEIVKDLDFARVVCDHIGSMTDQYASREYLRLYVPEYY